MWTDPDLYHVHRVGDGFIAIVSRPHGGDLLADALRTIHRRGVHTLLSLLTRTEELELGLRAEAELCRQIGLNYLHLPIDDRAVPNDRNRFRGIVDRLRSDLLNQEGIAVHCRAGIGRSAMVAAAVLVSAGCEPSDAIVRVSAARRVACPDTDEQRDWLIRNASLFASTRRSL